MFFFRDVKPADGSAESAAAPAAAASRRPPVRGAARPPAREKTCKVVLPFIKSFFGMGENRAG